MAIGTLEVVCGIALIIGILLAVFAFNRRCNITQISHHDSCSFIKPGHYNVTGEMRPTEQYPNGLLFEGTSIVQDSDTHGKSNQNSLLWNDQYDVIDKVTGKKLHDASITRDVKINPHGYISYHRDADIDDKYASSRNGYAIDSDDNSVKFDVQGNFHYTDEHHHNMEVTVEKKADGFEAKLFIDHEWTRTLTYSRE